MNRLVLRTATEADAAALADLLPAGSDAPLPDPAALSLLAEQSTVDGGATRVLGSVRLRPALGLALPRFSYHVGCTVHAARELELFHRQRTLQLGNDHTGSSELADFTLRRDELPLATQAAVLRLLVAAALLAIARERDRYAPRLVVELPGVCDAAGQSPFWDGLGRHFYTGDPAQAAQRHGRAWRSHVGALLPRHTVYASFLPPAAQAAVGQVSDDARLLRDLLEEAGLRYSHHVAVHDGGPLLDADLDALPGVTRARAWRVEAGEPPAASAPWLVMAGEGAALRAVRAEAVAGRGRLLLDAAARAALGVEPDTLVWAVPATLPA